MMLDSDAWPGLSSRTYPYQGDDDDPPLPLALQEMNTKHNGVLLADGYVRLFGYGGGGAGDARLWNDIDTWKWAWPQRRPVPYWMIGCTSLGGLFVFSLVDLMTAPDTAPVLYLEPFAMRSTFVLSKSCHEFISVFLANCAASPVPLTGIEEMRSTPLDWDEMILWDPPYLVQADSQPDWPDRYQIHHPFDVMVFNADAYRGAPDDPEDYVGCETFVDSRGRNRLRFLRHE